MLLRQPWLQGKAERRQAGRMKRLKPRTTPPLVNEQHYNPQQAKETGMQDDLAGQGQIWKIIACDVISTNFTHGGKPEYGSNHFCPGCINRV